ncbi:MAG: ADP-ribosylglycohydrolase family protein [Bacteroidota bacterium]
MENRNFVKDVLLGVAIGDALGVPVEFVSRGMRDDNPVAGMREGGAHNQKAGTWSDDTSLTLCLAEMLCRPYSLTTLGGYFVNWREHGFWTARGSVFDIGIATAAAIQKLSLGANPLLAGGSDEYSNGNGSLMRILPLVFYVRDMPVAERFAYSREVSSVTHRHIRSVLACFIYLEYARLLLMGRDKMKALTETRLVVLQFIKEQSICTEEELNKFHRVLSFSVGNYDLNPVEYLKVDEVYSGGYVIETLEASLWCILHTNSYSEAVLKAVNLGSDTDTTAAVTGGLAGILYGSETIPVAWLDVLAKRSEIEELAQRLAIQTNL